MTQIQIIYNSSPFQPNEFPSLSIGWILFHIRLHCCLVVTLRERADLLALVVMFFVIRSFSPLVSWDRCGTWLYWFLMLAVFLTLLGSILHFYSKFNRRVCKRTMKNLVRHRASASDLGLQCLYMSHKKNHQAYMLLKVDTCTGIFHLPFSIHIFSLIIRIRS